MREAHACSAVQDILFFLGLSPAQRCGCLYREAKCVGNVWWQLDEAVSSQVDSFFLTFPFLISAPLFPPCTTPHFVYTLYPYPSIPDLFLIPTPTTTESLPTILKRYRPSLHKNVISTHTSAQTTPTLTHPRTHPQTDTPTDRHTHRQTLHKERR